MAWRDNLQAIFFSGDGIVKKLWFLAFALATAVYGQNAALPVQFCQQGGTQAALSGLLSTNYQQGIIPSCTVTVYLTGTTTLATIYSNNSGTPLSNPFTASSTGQFLVFAAVNQGYDVVLSGGISPNTYPSPVTITGVYASQDFSGASSVSNSDGSLTISPTTGAVVASLNTANANTWTAQQTFLTTASFVGLSPDNASSLMTHLGVFLTNGAAVSPSTITLAYTGLASNSGSTGECWNTLGGQTLCGTTWPTSGDLVVSNTTNSPAGLAPVNGDCAIGAGGVWTAGSCGSGSVGSQGQVQVVGSTAGSFNYASIWNIGSGVLDSNDNMFLKTTAPTGWPFDTTYPYAITQDFVAGYGAGAALGSQTPFATTATGSSGSSTITLASAGTCGTPMSCVLTGMTFSAPGYIPAGTTGTISGTTVTLSANLTANMSGTTVYVYPGPTAGSVILGAGACSSLTAATGLVCIGHQTGENLITTGEGPEDFNSVLIGPDVATAATGASLTGIQPQQAFEENVFIGNKSYEHGDGDQDTIGIGNHLECPSLGSSNVWLGGNICATSWGADGSFILSKDSIFMGGQMFALAPLATSTQYSAPNNVYISPNGMGTWYDTNSNTIIGANFGQNSGSYSTLSSVTNSVFIEPGTQNSGANAFGINWVSGAGDVVITAKGYGSSGTWFGGGLTTGQGDSIFGAGAAATIGAGVYDTIIGDEAAPQFGDSYATISGAEALYSDTRTTGNSAPTVSGYRAFYSEVNGTYLTGQGYEIGYNETGNGETLNGYQAGDRSVASAGNLAAFGYHELYDTTGANAADEYDAFFGGSSDCTNASGCVYGISLGWGANITAATHATQIDAGTNATSNSLQFQSTPIVTTTALTAGAITGCGTVTSPVGNGLVGTFAAGATSCAPVITTGVTAPHGFVCEMHDWTTPADLLTQASTTSTTATFAAATVVSGDTIAFSCKAF